MSDSIVSNRPPTILIVDDVPANLGVALETLEEQGFCVLVAQDGAEGVKRAEFVRPDLILLDVMMPDMDGFEAVGQGTRFRIWLPCRQPGAHAQPA